MPNTNSDLSESRIDDLTRMLGNCAAALRYAMSVIPHTDPLFPKLIVTEERARAVLREGVTADAIAAEDRREEAAANGPFGVGA